MSGGYMSGGYESGGYESGGFESGGKRRVMHKRKVHRKKPCRRGRGIFEGEGEDFEGGGFLEDFGHGFLEGLQGVASVAAPIAQLAAQYGGRQMRRHRRMPEHMEHRMHPAHHMNKTHHHVCGGLEDEFAAMDLDGEGYMGGATHHLRHYKRKHIPVAKHDNARLRAAVKKMTKAELQRALVKAVKQ